MGIIYSPTGEPRLVPNAEEPSFLRQGYRRSPPNEKSSAPPIPEGEVGTSAATTENTVNVNSASLKDLTALPQVGTATAKRVQSQRPYQSLEDLIKAVPDVDWLALEPKISF